MKDNAREAPPSETLVEHFREVFRRWASGVAVIGACARDRQPHGMVASSLASVSVDPPQVVFSARRATRTHAAVEASGSFAASILASGQESLLERFTGTDGPLDADRFEGLRWAPAVSGAPILLDALAWIDCRVVAHLQGSDYTLFVGEVLAASLGSASESAPLLYFRRTAGTFLRSGLAHPDNSGSRPQLPG